MPTKREGIARQLRGAVDDEVDWWGVWGELAGLIADLDERKADKPAPVEPCEVNAPSVPLKPPHPTGGEERTGETLVMWLAERCGTSIFGIPTPAQVAEEGDRRIAALKAKLADAETAARLAGERAEKVLSLAERMCKADPEHSPVTRGWGIELCSRLKGET